MGIYRLRDTGRTRVCTGRHRPGTQPDMQLGMGRFRHRGGICRRDICRLGSDRPGSICPGRVQGRLGTGRRTGIGPVGRCSGRRRIGRRLGSGRGRGRGLRLGDTYPDRGRGRLRRYHLESTFLNLSLVSHAFNAFMQTFYMHVLTTIV